MKSLPLPAVVAALAALVTLPFHTAAGATLFLTAGLGAIIHADYVLRHRRLQWARLTERLIAASRASLPREPNRLAA